MMPQLHGELLEIRDVVLDLGQPILARHPGRTDARRFLLTALIHRIDIESRQRLGCDHEAAAVIESLEPGEKAPRELSVPVKYDPELARKAVRWAESVVPRGTPNADRVRRDRGFH